jgi:hypothetical protein
MAVSTDGALLGRDPLVGLLGQTRARARSAEGPPLSRRALGSFLVRALAARDASAG